MHVIFKALPTDRVHCAEEMLQIQDFGKALFIILNDEI